MSYVTRNPKTKEPTVWKDPEDCTDEQARVQEMRKVSGGLAEGLYANKPPTYPKGLFNSGLCIPSKRF